MSLWVPTLWSCRHCLVVISETPTPSPYLKCIFSILCLSLIFLHCILSYYLTLLYVPNMFDICFTYKNISSVRQELCLVHYCELYFWHLGSVEFDESMNCLVFESGSHWAFWFTCHLCHPPPLACLVDLHGMPCKVRF